jgi:hypothetical protein
MKEVRLKPHLENIALGTAVPCHTNGRLSSSAIHEFCSPMKIGKIAKND